MDTFHTLDQHCREASRAVKDRISQLDQYPLTSADTANAYLDQIHAVEEELTKLKATIGESIVQINALNSDK